MNIYSFGTGTAFILAFSAFANLACGKNQEQTIVISPTKYKPQTVSSSSLKGKTEFERHSCASCHTIGTMGGCLAPPLDGIGARRSKAFILARITNEASAIRKFQKLYPSAELMLHPRLSPQTAKQILSYLLTIPEPPGGFRISTHKIATKTPASKNNQHIIENAQIASDKGKSLFYEHGCIACHSIGKVGGYFAPCLDGISKRRDRAYITERISRAEFLTKNNSNECQERGPVMPPSNLSEEQIEQITTFLMSLPEQ